MYIPASFLEKNSKVISKFITENPLGTIFTAGASGLMVSLIPFLYQNKNEKPILVSHLAKANSHWKDLMNLKECLVVFRGAENYITPSWYATKKTTHKVVPTWNYEVVKIQGIPKIIECSGWLKAQIEELTNALEWKREAPWKVTNAPSDFIETQLKGIVGLEIEITDIQGKWKMSQNKSIEDTQGVINGLSDPNDPHYNLAVAKSMLSRLDKKFKD